ncbi:polysaccharide biosynthesis tyrosine autokinase [Myxosarcina sp. GI1]|uniref:GumC family protein n=1 Tax=Myxosarcina sp. GI1 TaxID=1541065 RepID=UPI000ACFEBB2|nr:polysaccharide biosynthesis tyrosine autokinase [Myxosarcina sp. GI1]
MAEGKILIKKLSTITSLTEVGEGIGQLQSVDDKESNPLETEKEMLLSIPLIVKTIETLNLTDDNNKPLTIEEFLNKVAVQQISKADILQVSYEDKDSERAAIAVNTLMKFYLQKNISTNQAEAKSAREFIEQQLPKAKVRENQAEQALYDFKAQNNLLISIEQQKEQASEILSDLDQKIIQIRAEYTDLSDRIRLLRNNLDTNSSAAISTTSLNEAFYNTVPDNSEEEVLLTRLEELEAQLAIQESRFTANHPDLVSSQAQVRGLKQQVLSKLEAKRQNLVNKIATLKQEKSAYKQNLMALPPIEQQLSQLESQLQTARSTYLKLIDKLETVKLAESQTVANAYILSPSTVPEQPVSSKSVVLLSGLLLSTLVSAASIWYLEYKDKSLKTVEEAKARLRLPVLGVIPQLNRSKLANLSSSNSIDFDRALVVKNNSIAPLTRSYSMLQTNLEFSQSQKGVKTIVVTSSIPQEGKSTVSFNLSKIMAQRGLKVLIVDADLNPNEKYEQYSSNLSEWLGIKVSKVNLNDILSGKVKYQTAIQRITDNIDLLPTESEASSSIARLDSSAIASSMEEFSADYDFVIIDTPPLITNSEALVLGKMADGIVMVVRLGLADTNSITLAKERLERSEQNVLGIVVNGSGSEREAYEYY